MHTNYPRALQLVLAHEGGYVNHPKDPGGATNKGITQGVYDAYRINKGLKTRSVEHITSAEVADIYCEQYWKPVKGDDLPSGIDYAVFDYAVNSGVGRASKELQRVVGVTVDGAIGQATIAATARMAPVNAVMALQSRRLRFLKSLKIWGTFGKGWARRVAEVQAEAIRMAGQEEPKKAPEPIAKKDLPQAAGQIKATEDKQAQLKTAVGQGSVLAGCGTLGQTMLAASEQVKPNIGETLIGRLAFAAFVLLILIGGGLLAMDYYRKWKEKRG